MHTECISQRISSACPTQIFAKCNVLHMSEEANLSVMGTNEGQNPYLV